MPTRTRRPTQEDCVDFDPKTVVLKSGSHGSVFRGETCLVEAACQATIACTSLAKKYGKPQQFGDDHPSISRVVRSFAIGVNDAWDDETRQRLRPYVTEILGTATTPEDEETRAWMATDWLARVHAPAFLRVAGLTEHAQSLESLARIVDTLTAEKAQPTLNAARNAAESAARNAARNAAESAAVNAARNAAASAAESAAENAARNAAASAAWSAAWSAAESAAASAAANATRETLAPVVAELQTSALALLDAMIAVGRTTERG